MAGKLISRRVILATTYIPLADSTLVGSVLLTNEGTNTAYIQGTDVYDDIELGAGKQYEHRGVDLSTIYVKGTAADVITVIGQAGAAGL